MFRRVGEYISLDLFSLYDAVTCSLVMFGSRVCWSDMVGGEAGEKIVKISRADCGKVFGQLRNPS